MTHDELTVYVQELKDREEIRACLATYCRAVDRMDRELLLSVYHPDAVDDHGAWVANPESFADSVFPFQTEHLHASQHVIANHVCEIDGNIAHTETYYIYFACNKTGSPLMMSGGRYIDRFEKRDGKWAIAARLVVSDWRGQPGPDTLSEELLAHLNSGGGPARDRSDPSYMRPLRVRTPRQGTSK